MPDGPNKKSQTSTTLPPKPNTIIILYVHTSVTIVVVKQIIVQRVKGLKKCPFLLTLAGTTYMPIICQKF